MTADVLITALEPEKIKFRLEASFTLEELIKIRDSLKRDWEPPMSRLASAIDSCVLQAEKVYWPKKVEE